MFAAWCRQFTMNHLSEMIVFMHEYTCGSLKVDFEFQEKTILHEFSQKCRIALWWSTIFAILRIARIVISNKNKIGKIRVTSFSRFYRDRKT